MQRDFWPSSDPPFAQTREQALRRLGEFAQTASRYSRERNHVMVGHPNVSRLSPAIRHRLITEREVAQSVLDRYAFSTVEKFLQEIYWRRYWKSWLSMRPQVWSQYLGDLEDLRGSEGWERAQEVIDDGGPVGVMNDFAAELQETGYLHNHARMWFAAYWVHTLQLPWQLGADFFFRHLLDSDPASNTLSWRWVAGLQTPGKSYLARRSNLEKYLDAEIIQKNPEGLELLETPSPLPMGPISRVPANPATSDPSHAQTAQGRVGLWIHEEDLLAGELLRERHFEQVFITGDLQTWNQRGFSEVKQKWLTSALADTQYRCQQLCGQQVRLEITPEISEGLIQWAEEAKLQTVMALRPEVGLVHDGLSEIEQRLAERRVALLLVDREEDLQLAPFGKAGFFPFWKKVSPIVRALGSLSR